MPLSIVMARLDRIRDNLSDTGRAGPHDRRHGPAWSGHDSVHRVAADGPIKSGDDGKGRPKRLKLARMPPDRAISKSGMVSIDGPIKSGHDGFGESTLKRADTI